MFVQLDDLVSNKQKQHYSDLVNRYTASYKSICILITIFFSLVTKKSVQNITGIFRISHDMNNCINVRKYDLKELKIQLQNEENMP